MQATTFGAAIRRFPLLGRPRPDCPPLPQRITEIIDLTNVAGQKVDRGIDEAAHAFNKAALIASDAGMTDLAHDLCRQHIDAYCNVDRPLTFFEARYMLEPVINLARLQIRADHGEPAVLLLKAVYEAVTKRTDLEIADRTLPTADLVGEPAERRKLLQWLWLQLLGDGIRALAMANRWTDAADHARAYNGIGNHLMEGRQALIVAECALGNLAEGRKILNHTLLTQPWEQQVASCLQLLCATPDTDPENLLANAMRRLATPPPTTNYASYHARVGLTLSILTNGIRPEAAPRLLHRTARLAINSTDGYAARDMLSFRDPIEGISARQTSELTRIAQHAGLGIGELPEPALQSIARVADAAGKVLEIALKLATVNLSDRTTRPLQGS
jgi:hypothetical protein